MKKSFSFVRLAAVAACLASFVSSSFAQSPTTQPTKKLRVAVYQDKGAGEKGWTNVSKCLAVLPDGFDAYKVDAQDIRDGKLAGADVLVQPGGSGSGQAKQLEEEGREIIKQFVKNGGGYVGICAGAYLSTNDYTWSLGFINAKVLDRKHWNRGTGTVKIKFTELGKKILGTSLDVSNVEYFQGPILAPSTQPDMPAYLPLATYETEIAKNGAIPGLMLGATAMAASEYGKGHVIAISPHPERSEGLDGIVRRAIQWAATGDVK
ncbi:MAG: BPL-N domain-containing protein [Tepidisphaeraceae bacterium]